MCLCVLSERSADGECCRPQEHQSGRDLGLPGAGCLHRWCKRTPDFLDPAVFQFCLTSRTCLQPVNGSTVQMLPVTYDFSSLNSHCKQNQLVNLNDTKYILKLGLRICSFPNLLFLSALLALQLCGDERCSSSLVYRESNSGAPGAFSCFFKDYVRSPWRWWWAHPIAQLVWRQWHQVIFGKKWYWRHRSGPWQQHQ